MTEKELKVPFSAPLNELDTEEQTYGCRANNSDSCSTNKQRYNSRVINNIYFYCK